MKDRKKKDDKRRLAVKKEALRTLTSKDLEKVAGGGFYDTKCCPRTTCI